MNWQECNKRRLAKDVQLDRDLITALRKTSENKLESESKLELSDITASSKLFLAYDSLRELLEALALKHGYKIYNHECYTAFLKEILLENTKGEEFDELRQIRNSINYYGKDILQEEAKKIIERIRVLRNSILILLER